MAHIARDRAAAATRSARPYRSHVARLFVEHAVRCGVEAQALVDGLGIRLEQEAVVELPFHEVERLAEVLAQRCGRVDFGLDAARNLPRGAYGVVEYMFANAATVGDGLELLLRFQALNSELAHVSSSRADGRYTFEHWIDHPAVRHATHTNEFALAAYVVLGERIIGVRPRFRAVRFMHADAGRRALLEQFFDAPVELGAPRNALVFDDSFLATPIATADPKLFDILSERARRDLELVEPHGDVVSELVATYRRLLAERPRQAQALDVATALGLSVRSMHRRLAEAGTSFRAIEARVKHALAREHLADAQLTLTDIAFLLGFADTSAFIRAFRRWCGESPKQVRDALRARAGVRGRN